MGEHWGPQNPIPRIQQFMESERQERARQTEEENEAKRASKAGGQEQPKPEEEQAQRDGDVMPHRERQIAKHKTRKVTDPITGRDIEVEDQGEQSMEAVKSPSVCCCSLCWKFC